MGQLKLSTIIEEDSGIKSHAEASTKVTFAEDSNSIKKGTTAPKTKYESPKMLTQSNLGHEGGPQNDVVKKSNSSDSGSQSQP